MLFQRNMPVSRAWLIVLVALLAVAACSQNTTPSTTSSTGLLAQNEAGTPQVSPTNTTENTPAADARFDSMPPTPILLGTPAQPVATAAQRPIPTLNAAMVTPFTPAPQAQVTPTPQPTEPDPTPLPTLQFIGDGPTLVGRSELQASIRQTRDNLRELVFIINEANRTGTLDCTLMSDAYALVANAPTFQAPSNLEIANAYYTNGVNIAVTGLSNLNFYCLDLIDVYDRETAKLGIGRIQPQEIWLTAYEQAQLALAEIYSAVEWMAATAELLRSIYLDVRSAMGRYGQELNDAFFDNCINISAQYAAVMNSPELAPPIGERLTSYGYYREAIASVQAGGLELIDLCAQLETDASAFDLAGSLPQNFVSNAKDGYTTGLYALDVAENALGEAPTPTPVPSPVRVSLFATRPSAESGFWEIVLNITVLQGVPPYSAWVGGFQMDAQNTITITHTCNLDFLDNVTAQDANGQTYVSDKILLRRGAACP